MASLILSTAGNAAFGPVGGFIGALVGSAIDNAAASALTPARIMPSRLAGLKVQTSQEGTPIPIVYGRFRVAGQIIWASKFKESSTQRRVGGKGGQRVVERSYSISFAIGLCEGPIEGLGQVWVNGERFDLATTPHRLYLGSDSQMPDPLIEALEGLSQAPAFRDLAYIVFEDFGLSAYNDRIPQFSFEIMASPKPVPNAPPRFADLARGVCLIPGAGEFAYATTPIRKITGPGEEVGENLHASAHRADFDVAIDQLVRDFPAVKSVSLVVAWFGTDLRAGQCQILPKVEDVTKQTTPRAWSVAGLSRSNAARVSLSDGKPAYGGSPDDQSVIEAIVALKGRGIKVTHNPFVMMDIAAGNALPNPFGGVGQPPYPWRGRITCFPAIGQAGSVDGSGAATAQVAAFFGTATASHFSVVNGQVRYSGPNEWSYRRFILHQAALCVAAGGVDSFLIGSELIGLTRVRGAGNDFPAVQALIVLLGEVRALLGPAVKLSYGADWTEYGAYVPPASNNLHFPLDPLWANANLDYIGLDWYAPLADRRSDEPRADFAALQSGIEAGEAYDFYYASDAHRTTKTRTPISDGTYQEPWVFRQKDIRSFWSNPHFERVGGVRKTTPTPWVAKSKPLALMELGFPAVDKGANRPSVFPDPKSVESGLPPFSTGVRDDGEQRVALEATLAYWRDNNPVSPLYGGAMLDLARCHIWAWDARPFPQFPSLTELWSDGAYAMLGHWLAGRTGRLSVASILKDLAARAGLAAVNVDGVSGFVDGYGVEAPASARALMESLMVVFGLEAQAGAGGLILRDIAPAVAQIQIGPDAILSDDNGLRQGFSHNPQDGPQGARFSAYAPERDYLPATHSTAATGQDGPAVSLAAPLVLGADARATIAAHLVRVASPDRLTLEIGPALAARLQVGDRFSLTEADAGDVWRIDRLEGGWQQTLTASRAPDSLRLEPSYAPPVLPAPPIVFSPPVLLVLDACAPFASPTNPGPLVGCAASPWPGDIDIWAGNTRLGTCTKPATLAHLTQDLAAGPVGRRLRSTLVLETRFGASLPAIGQAALLDNGAIVDVIDWQAARLIGPNVWEITHWVRGLDGASSGPALPAGTVCVVLDTALTQMNLDPNWLGQPLNWRAIPQSDARLERTSEHTFQGRARLPWPPVHVRARRTASGIALSWVRRARGNGEAWSPANAPLGANAERYEVTILSTSGEVKRASITAAPQYLYPAAEELTDFGTPQSSLTLDILQIGDDDLRGRPRRVVIDL